MNYYSILIILNFLNLNYANFCDKNKGSDIIFECKSLPGYNRPQFTKCVTSQYIEKRSNHQHFCRDLNATYCYYPCMLENYDVDHGFVNDNCNCDLSIIVEPHIIKNQSNRNRFNMGFLFVISSLICFV